jgi:hypothetical protein
VLMKKHLFAEWLDEEDTSWWMDEKAAHTGSEGQLCLHGILVNKET